MRVPHLLMQITRAMWMIHPRIAIEMGPIVAELMAGNLTFDGDKAPFSAEAFTPNGERLPLYAMDANGKINSMYDNAPKGSHAIIPLKGVMMKEDSMCDYGTESIARITKEAAAHQNIASIIFDSDSGGGAVDSIPPMLDAIAFAKKHVPVIGLADLSASANYYIMAATDKIIASNDISSEFGSIGVMVSWSDVQPYWEAQGIKFHRVYAPESDHKNLPFEMAMKGNYDLLKSEVLSPLAKKFQADVRKFRAGKIDITQKGILNGKMYFAKDAMKYGLIDEIGNMEHAIKRASEMAKHK